MLRKIVCLILTAMMALCCFCASAEVDYTLAEKIQNQMKAGSGLSGSLVLTADGTSPLALSLEGLSDTEIQVRALRGGLDEHIALFLGEDDYRAGLTEFLKQDDIWFFRSDLLPEATVWQLPNAFELGNALHPTAEDGNPSFLPALIRVLQMTDSRRSATLDPVLEKLTGWLEVWLADFSSVSVVRKLDNGTSGVDLMYNIPMREIRQEIVDLIQALVRDPDGQALLNAIFTEDQMEVYANPYLDYYYLDALSSLDNDYDVVYTRTMTTLGQTVASSLEMPLDEGRFGFQTLDIEDNGGLISVTFRGDDSILALQVPRDLDFSQIDAASLWLYYRPAQPDPAASDGPEAMPIQGEAQQPIAARVDLSRENTLSSDEDNRLHLRDVWSLTATYDLSRLPDGEKASDYPAQDPLNGLLSLHYSSRNAQASPTTLEINVSLSQGSAFNLGLSGQLKTVAPWVFSPFDTYDAQEFLSLDETSRATLLAEWLSSTGELMQQARDGLLPTPIPTEEPSPTPTAEPTSTPEVPAEVTVEPAEVTEEPAEATEEPPVETEEPAEVTEEPTGEVLDESQADG